jgi:hypothetical protein
MLLVGVFASFLPGLFDEALSPQTQLSHPVQVCAEASAAMAAAVIIVATEVNPASTQNRTTLFIASSEHVA